MEWEWESIYPKEEWAKLEQGLQAMAPEWSLDPGRLMRMLVQGQGEEALREMAGGIKANLFLEWGSWKGIFITITIVILISAVFSTLMEAFPSHQIADVAFYVNYLILIILFIGLFQEALAVGEETLGSIEEFMRIFFPTYCMALGLSGGQASGLAYYQLACLAIYGIEWFLEALLLPVISGHMLFCVMNGIWGEERLERLLVLVKKGVRLTHKLTLGLLTGASLIQSMITPVIERLKRETVYQAMETVPGVGELTEGAMRVWLGSALLIKNSIGLVGCFLLLFLTLSPLVKLAVTGLLLKASAALLGLVGDKRMLRFADDSGDSVFLLLGTVAQGILFFLALIAIAAFTMGGSF